MPADSLADTLATLQLAPAIRHRNLSIFPLLAADEAAPDFLTLDEALKGGHARVTEVSEGGSVPELFFENLSDRSILLLDGEELVGAKQNRVLNVTLLAGAHSRIRIPVTCVEQGRWAWKSRHFNSSDLILYAGLRAHKMEQVSESLHYGSRHANQVHVWEDIALRRSRENVHSPTGAMSDLYEQTRDRIEDYQRAFTAQPRQCGSVFAVNGRITGLELFAHSHTYAHYSARLIKSHALDALHEFMEDIPQHDEVGARALLDRLGKTHGRRYPALGEGEDLRIQQHGLTAAALIVHDRVLHLAAFTLAEEK
jgi:hypothetical protein